MFNKRTVLHVKKFATISSHLRTFGIRCYMVKPYNEDDIVIDETDNLIWAPLTKTERRQREKDLRPKATNLSELPKASPPFFRNRSIPSSPFIDPLTSDVIEDAQYLFSLTPHLSHSCGTIQELPPPQSLMPEVAIVGRSNVGKSSLVNALLGKDISVVSQTPGRTRRLNFFNVGNYAYVVDLPGYGHAEGNKKKIQEWNQLILEYVTSRTSLKRVFMLVDARHGFLEADLKFLDAVSQRVTIQFILTKCDAVDIEKIVSTMQGMLDYVDKNYPLVLPIITATSSLSLEGIKEARGWLYASTGLVERLALLNSLERARALSMREKEIKIALKEVNPYHPIFRNDLEPKMQTIVQEPARKSKKHEQVLDRKKKEQEITEPQTLKPRKSSIIYGIEEFQLTLK